MRRNLNKLLAILLAAAMILGMFPTAFAAQQEPGAEGERAAVSADPVSEEPAATVPAQPRQNVNEKIIIDSDSTDGYEGDYVVIYNPSTSSSSSYSTGTMTGLIETSVNSSVAPDLKLDPEKPFYKIDVDPQLASLAEEAETEAAPAEPEATKASYKVGDTKTFSILSDYSPTGSGSVQFKCLYVGQHCYIWTPTSSSNNTYPLDTIDTSFAGLAAAEFDSKFDLMQSSFGNHTNGSNGDGKLHMLYYNINDGWEPGQGYIAGFFYQVDLSNNGLPILNIDTYPGVYYKNSAGVETIRIDDTYGTMVHEYQHLINYSNTRNMSTWLNECFSAAAEEICYPGSSIVSRIQSWEGYYYSENGDWLDPPDEFQYSSSNSLHKGYSMYSWSNSLDNTSLLTLYAQVSFFAQYLFTRFGNTIYKQISSNYSSNEATMITNATGVSCTDLVRDFRIAVTANAAQSLYNGVYGFKVQNNYDPDKYHGVQNPYDLLAPVVFTGSSCSIKGGGAITVKPVNGVYNPPSGANSNLKYIGISLTEKTDTDGYYLIGSMNSWSVDNLTEAYRFAVSADDENEYVLSTTLAMEDEFKVVKVVNGAIDAWYPDNADNFVVNDSRYEGDVEVRFRPNGDGDLSLGWYHGFILIPVEDITSELPNGYYLIGTMNGWSAGNLTVDDLFAVSQDDPDEYVLNTTLAIGDEFKVVKVVNGFITEWYPDNADNYVIDEQRAGDLQIRFRPNGDGDTSIGWYLGYIYIPSDIPDGYYLIGSMNNWTIDATSSAYLFSVSNGDPNEYVLTTTLNVGDELKVIHIVDGVYSDLDWYPSGEDNNYVIDVHHAGEREIRFRPNGDGDSTLGWYCTYIYIPCDLPDGYYMIGSVNEWTTENFTEAHLFTLNPDDENEYYLNISLEVGDSFKVVHLLNGYIEKNPYNGTDIWIPDGDNYAIEDILHAGNVTVYFRPDGQGDQDYGWYQGYILINPRLELTFINTLSLESDTSLNYYINKSSLDDYLDVSGVSINDVRFVVEREMPGEDENEIRIFQNPSISKKGQTYYYVFSFPNIAAKQLNNQMVAHIEFNMDGIVALSNTRDYNPISYCYQVGLGTGNNILLRHACADLILYAAAAQIKFGYNLDNLPDEEGSQWNDVMDDLARSEDYVAANNSVKTAYGDIINITSVTLALEGRIEMNLRLTPEDLSGLNFNHLKLRYEYVDINDVTVTGEIDSDQWTSSGSVYVVIFAKQSAAEMFNQVKFEVVLDENDTQTVLSNAYTVSVSDYAGFVISLAGSNQTAAALAPLMQKMLNYGASAYEYFHQ